MSPACYITLDVLRQLASRGHRPGYAEDLRQDFRAGGNPQRNWEIRNVYFPINARLAAGSTVCVNSPVPVGSVNSIRTSLPMPWMYL